MARLVYALQFLFGVLMLAIFGPPYLLIVGNAARRDYFVKRHVRLVLASQLTSTQLWSEK